MKNFKFMFPLSMYPSKEYADWAQCQDAEKIKSQVCKKCNFRDFGIYKNDKYSITVYPVNRADDNSPLSVYMKIRDNDWSARHDWRDFQEIKNKMFGSECEGVEVYPPESHLQDTANCYWMTVFIDHFYKWKNGDG